MRWAFLLFVSMAQAQTAATPQGHALYPTVTAVVNGASFQPGIVSGSWATIVGTDLANTTRGWTASDFVNGALPPSLSDTGVVINGKQAFVSFVSPTQVNVLVPDDASLGNVTILVTTQFISSGVAFANKVAYAPALFTFTAKYPAAAHNADGSYCGPANLLPGVTTTPAYPGEVIQLFGTGFGPTNPLIPTGMLFTKPEPVAQTVTATVGGVPANVAGYLIFPGVYQLNLTVPALPDGDAAVSIMIGGVSSQSGLMLSIAN
jgi:uncharacterized protein (TIGR03437 family)